jgi:hypothetical protein
MKVRGTSNKFIENWMNQSMAFHLYVQWQLVYFIELQT